MTAGRTILDHRVYTIDDYMKFEDDTDKSWQLF